MLVSTIILVDRYLEEIAKEVITYHLVTQIRKDLLRTQDFKVEI